jgi:hypothetical protein
MALKHVETTISETSIRMRLANDTDPAKATETVDLLLPIGNHLKLPDAGGGPEYPLGQLATRQLSSIQLATLRYVRDEISAETQRLSGLSRS